MATTSKPESELRPDLAMPLKDQIKALAGFGFTNQ